jgi:hypothetical protein
MFTFTPMTEEEINAASLIEAGIYDFQVISSVREISKAGNHQAKMQLKVWDNIGKEHFIYDWLVFSDKPLNIRKIKHFCEGVGLEEEYKKGSIPEALFGKCGKVEIGIQDERPDGKGGFYPKQNKVIDYVKGGIPVPKKSIDQPKSELDDDIPF